MIKLPEGITLEQLQENWRVASNEYSKALTRAKLLDATDRGRFWKAIGAVFPSYQILPDTNYVSFVKSNLLASLYSVGRSASMMPTSDEDKQTTNLLNIWLDHFWHTADVGYYQMQAGERAALLNVGYTQVGWDNEVVGGSGDNFHKGDPVLKNLDPLKFMRDPYAENIENAGYAMYPEDLHKSVILENKEYLKEFKSFLDSQPAGNVISTHTVDAMRDHDKTAAKSNKDYFRIITHWIRYQDGNVSKVAEIHTVDNKHVLLCKPDLKPAEIPVAELYCNLPAGDLIGTSEPSKIFANYVAYNLSNSIILTAAYKNQRPPRYVNYMSKLNMRSFVEHGNDADYTFVVQGDANRAVHYHEFPEPSPAVQTVAATMSNDIKSMSGVTDKYTGADTGSLLTTGGMEQMLDQATMIDQPKINNYERYAKRLSKLILSNMLNHNGFKRNYFVKNPKTGKHQNIEVDFPDINPDTAFDYELNISAELPKNKQRLAQMANVLMEKQMQYSSAGNQGVNLLRPEEWLMMQDFPMKEYMLERMGLERSTDYVKKISRILFSYSDMTQQGVPPEEALMATAQIIEEEDKGVQQRDQQQQAGMQIPNVQNLV